MPCGCAGSVMKLVNDVKETGSKIQLSLAALIAAPLHPTARVVDEGAVVVKCTVNSGRRDISGSQVLIGFLLGL